MACRSCSAALNSLSQRSSASLRQLRPSSAEPISPKPLSNLPLAARRYYHPSSSQRTSQTAPRRDVATKTTDSKPAAAAAAKFSPPAKPISSPSTTTAAPDGMSTGAMQAFLRKGIQKGVRAGDRQKYAVYGATERLVEVLCRQAAYRIDPELRKAGTVPETENGEQLGVGEGIWFEKFGLQPTFSTWAQVTMLHLYLIVARLRGCDEETFKSWQAQLVDHFFHKAEARMGIEHEITSGMMRQRYLKDVFVQWRGLIMAYDEGVAKGDAVLGSAVWRNLYKGSEDVDVEAVAAVVNFMRRCLFIQDQMGDEEFLASLEEMGVAEKTGQKVMFTEVAKGAFENVD